MRYKYITFLFARTFLVSFFLLFTLVQLEFLHPMAGFISEALLKPGVLLIQLLFSQGNGLFKITSLFQVLFVSSLFYGVLFIGAAVIIQHMKRKMKRSCRSKSQLSRAR